MKTKIAAILGIVTICITIFSCISSPDFPDEPIIEFVSYSKSTMKQGKTADDSLFLVINVTDGDGDIGSGDTVNLFLEDNRTGNLYTQYRVPQIPEGGANNGIEAVISIKVYNTCCLQPDGPENCDNVTVPSNILNFNIYLIDNAGNNSNIITTPDIELICN